MDFVAFGNANRKLNALLSETDSLIKARTNLEETTHINVDSLGAISLASHDGSTGSRGFTYPLLGDYTNQLSASLENTLRMRLEQIAVEIDQVKVEMKNLLSA